MQKIIKLGFFMVLCVSTSLWARPGLKSPEISEMPELVLPPPAVGLGEQIFLGERLPEKKGTGIECLVNDIKNDTETKEYIEGLQRGDVSIDNFPRKYKNEVEFLMDLKQEIQANNGAKSIQFKRKPYKTMLDDGSLIISAI